MIMVIDEKLTCKQLNRAFYECEDSINFLRRVKKDFCFDNMDELIILDKCIGLLSSLDTQFVFEEIKRDGKKAC